MHSIFILEDEKDLGLTLAENLTTENQECSLYQSCKEAYIQLQKSAYDIYILDINLKDGNGLDVAKFILDRSPTSSIILLSAIADPELRLQGLELGAFDFINKPFTLRELQIKIDRIKKEIQVLRAQAPVLEFGLLKVDFAKFELTDAYGKITTLTHKECSILKLFIDNLNLVISRDHILDHVWGKESYPSLRTIDNYIVNLRRWCDSDKNQSLVIHSIRGIGYKMTSKE